MAVAFMEVIFILMVVLLLMTVFVVKNFRAKCMPYLLNRIVYKLVTICTC